jgi:GntR family transcriptional repressor for pyruvate dehydrogenase complex
MDNKVKIVKKQADRSKAEPLFRPVVGTRPADEIQSQIRALLSSHYLKAGARLPSERELSEQFGVSRNSVRQALRSLVDSGLLEMKKGAAGGAFIRDGGGDAVMAGLTDLYSLGTIQPSHLSEVRILIGVETVRLACERGTPEEIDALEANVKLAEQAVRDGNMPLRTNINLEFYRMLARMTRNPLLVVLTDSVMAITKTFAEEFMRTSSPTVMPYRKQLVRDLRAGDTEAAAERTRQHLLRLQTIYLKAMAAERPGRSS